MNDRAKLLLEILGILIALAALIVALLNWLAPFNPIGSSPVQAISNPTAADTPIVTITNAPAATATGARAITLTEVATGKPTSASGYWQYSSTYSFPSQAIVDRQTKELHCDYGVQRGNTYWLLPHMKSGWVQVDLERVYSIAKLRWLNTHNGSCADRATTRYHIALSETGDFNGEEVVAYQGSMAFSTSPDFQETVLVTPLLARYVRFYVDEYYKSGGGLNELEIYAETTLP